MTPPRQLARARLWRRLGVVHLRKFRVFSFKGPNFIHERVNRLADEKMILAPFGVIEMVQIHDGNKPLGVDRADAVHQNVHALYSQLIIGHLHLPPPQ